MFDESKIGGKSPEKSRDVLVSEEDIDSSAPTRTSVEQGKGKPPALRTPLEIRRKVLEDALKWANDTSNMQFENAFRQMIRELDAQAGKTSSLGLELERVRVPKKQSKEIEKLRNETRINVLNLYLKNLEERRAAAKGEEKAGIEQEEQYVKSEIEKEEQKREGAQDKVPMEGTGSISGT